MFQWQLTLHNHRFGILVIVNVGNTTITTAATAKRQILNDRGVFETTRRQFPTRFQGTGRRGRRREVAAPVSFGGSRRVRAAQCLGVDAQFLLDVVTVGIAVLFLAFALGVAVVVGIKAADIDIVTIVAIVRWKLAGAAAVANGAPVRVHAAAAVTDGLLESQNVVGNLGQGFGYGTAESLGRILILLLFHLLSNLHSLLEGDPSLEIVLFDGPLESPNVVVNHHHDGGGREEHENDGSVVERISERVGDFGFVAQPTPKRRVAVDVGGGAANGRSESPNQGGGVEVLFDRVDLVFLPSPVDAQQVIDRQHAVVQGGYDPELDEEALYLARSFVSIRQI